MINVARTLHSFRYACKTNGMDKFVLSGHPLRAISLNMLGSVYQINDQNERFAMYEDFLLAGF